MPSKKSTKPTKHSTVKNQSGGVVVSGSVHCADFIGRDQHNVTYGFSAADVERLVEKVLAFLQAGAVFLPSGTRNDMLRAEVNGEMLTFHPGAALQLAMHRNERAYWLSLTIRREYQLWATKFIPLAAQVDVRPVALEMPIAYSEFILPRLGAGPEAKPHTEPLEDITRALDKHTAFVILGEPGAGKTTTLQKMAFEQAKSRLSGEPGRTPFFVRISEQGAKSPFEFLHAKWVQHTGGDLADALAAGRVLLLADGLNELPRDDRAERLKAWRLFAADYASANQFVFSGRERDYEGLLDLPRVRVDPLDDARISDYLKRNEVPDLEQLLDDPKTSLREMARNPFNLSLLVFAWKSNQREMGNRGALLPWFVGELFTREERLAHKGWLPREAQIPALAQLADAMQQSGGSTTLPNSVARRSVPPVVEVNGDEIAIKPADLFRFARSATILDPATVPDVRFYHHLLQEYFAALELLRRFLEDSLLGSEGEDFWLIWQGKRLIEEMPPVTTGEWDPLPEPPATGWEVTTILATGIAPDPAALIAAIRIHNPVLAGRCLTESGVPPVALNHQKSAIQQDLLHELYDSAVHLRARMQAGYVLGRVGDPRFTPHATKGVQVIVPEMVTVPAGQYVIGSADGDPEAFDWEKPQFQVDLPTFAIGKWPVTNAEFACFIEAGGYKDERWWTTELARRWLKGESVTGGPLTYWMDLWKLTKENANWRQDLESTGNFAPDQLKVLEEMAGWDEQTLLTQVNRDVASKSREQPHYWTDAQYNNPSQPIVGVTWFEANAYCTWLSEVIERSFRLSTEAEWEAAARSLEGRRFAWGNEWDTGRANTMEGRVFKPSPVGLYQASGGAGPFGAEDQTGNVWEWNSSLFQPYPYQDGERENLEAEGERVMRGGAWLYNRRGIRCASRDRGIPAYFDNDLGFRIVAPVSR